MGERITPRTVLRRFWLWLAICCISAAPSFYVASLDHADRAGMAGGVLLFVVIYTLLTSTSRFERFYERPYIRATMRFGYGLRMFLSVLTVLGTFNDAFFLPLWPDLFCGVVTARIAESIFGVTYDAGTRRFGGAMLFTCIQGAILNCVVFAVMAIFYGFRRAYGKPMLVRGFDLVPMAKVVDESDVAK